MDSQELQAVEGIGNKKQIALERAGATREASYKAMVEGLSAMSMTVDKFGDEHFTEDHTARLKSAELISRLNGDLKESPTVDNRTVTITGIGTEAMEALFGMVKDVTEQLVALRNSGQQTGEIIDVDAT